MDEIKQAALKYAEMGLAVIPVNPRNKHPYTRNGSKDASKDPKIITEWWTVHPYANVGIATGAISNLVVIDEDVDEAKGKDGIHEVSKWESENGELPPTWTAITGRGGYHLYYRITDGDQQRNRTGILDGVDVRGEGGYVIAPPSIHPNGNHYEWEYAPDDCNLATADETVKKFLSISGDGSENEAAGETKPALIAPDVVPEGKRNDTIFRLACGLWSKNFTKEAIIAALMAMNKDICSPPLEDKEIETIVNSVTKRFKQGLPATKENMVIDKNGWREPEFKINKDGKPYQSISNYAEAIEWDKELFGKIKYNILTYDTFIFGELPWEKVRTHREWMNSDDANLKAYIEDKYGFTNLTRIEEALTIVSNKYAYNPVTEMLLQCHNKWDKQTDHIENLLPNYLGVEKNRYSIEVMKIFMLGAIARAFNPGCKFDYTIIIYGDQGCGKSTFLRRLAMNDAWFNGNFNTFEGDKAFEKIKGMWIVEMAELLAAKKTKDVEAIKSFLTAQDDTYRTPYKARVEKRPRVCVFAGTTNDEHFLTDTTGNRRFLPITAGPKNTYKWSIHDKKASLAEIKQAWGEAMEIFMKATNNGTEPDNLELVLPKEVESMAQNKQKEFLEEDARIGIIQNWLDNNNFDKVCVAMIYEHALGNTGKQPTRIESKAIHAIMKSNITGWKRLDNNGGRAKCSGYGTQICYVPINSDSSEIKNEVNPFK